MLSAYPDKFAKRRKKHLNVAKTGRRGESPTKARRVTECDVKSNIKSIPGVMTIRGCAYAGSKGVVWGPIKDMVHISHGPVGCGQYSWSQRRNYYIGKTGIDTFVTMQFTSDFQESDIVFGGDKKLDKVIDEINTLFPLAKGVTIQSECPIGLIGDDIEAVAKKKAKEIGKTIVPVRCEGFRGVSQSLGHHIANDAIRDWVFDKKDGANGRIRRRPYDVNVIGDYNIGGDAWASRILLEEIGLRVVGNWSGDATLAEIERAPKAKLNLIHCYRSMNYICRHMEEKYGVAWMEYNFFGPSQIEASLRKIAKHFGPEIEAKAEAVIAKYRPLVDAVIAKYKPRLEGKTVMLYVGGLRPRHVITAYEDLGMEIVGTGYEFGHGDDYQRTGHYVKNGTLIYDDVTGYELEKFIEKVRPDLVGSGIKEKYPVQKMGIPFRQMHSWDYSGPYHGYDGFAIFARDMDLAINNPVWELFEAPWDKPQNLAPSPPSDRIAPNESAEVPDAAGPDPARPRNTQFCTAPPYGAARTREEPNMPQSAENILDHAPLFREPEYQEMLARKKAKFECGVADAARSPSRAELDQDLGISRKEPRARGAGGQSRQGLPAARRGVRRRRLREDDVLRAWLAGLRRLLPLAPVAPFQGAVLRGLLVDDRGRGGVRRPQQHGRRPRQRLFALRAEDDRGLHDLHGRSHRRRSAFLHRDRQGQELGPGGIRRSLRPYAGLRRQPRRRLRQHGQGRAREFLEGQGRAQAERARSTSSPVSTASASATIAN